MEGVRDSAPRSVNDGDTDDRHVLAVCSHGKLPDRLDLRTDKKGVWLCDW